MESTFAGLDFGKLAGKHLTTQMLESLGRDLCRTILIYSKLYVPDELKGMFKARIPPPPGKTFKEPENEPDDFADLVLCELQQDKNINKTGDGDSSSGSDSAPSDDNLEASELIKNLPEADKTLKKKIK
jgi:hypothetical protein